LFGESTVAMLSDHAAGFAELLEAPATVMAAAAGDEVVQTHPLADALLGYAVADRGNDACYLMAESKWEITGR
jgi:hypothetical protein